MNFEQHHEITDLTLFRTLHDALEKKIDELFVRFAETNKIGDFLNLTMQKIYYSKSLKNGEERAYIHLASQLNDVIFSFATNSSSKKVVDFKNETYIIEKNENFKTNYHSNYASLISGIYLAVIARNQASLDTLLECPLDKLEHCSRNLDPFFRNYVQFLRAALLRNDEAGPMLLVTLESSFPEKVKSTSQEYLEAIHLPSLELWGKLLARDHAGYQVSLKQSLSKFASYWSRDTKLNRGDKFRLKEKPEGFLSIPTSAICEIARDNEILFECCSDYLISTPLVS